MSIVNRVNKFTSTLLNKQLTVDQFNYVKTLVDYHSKSTLPTNELVMRIALDARESFMNRPTRMQTYNDDFDLHALLTEMIMKPYGPNDLGAQQFSAKAINKYVTVGEDQYDFEGLMSKGDLLSLTRAFNPAATHKTAYITLDSSVAQFSNDNTKLQWDYMSVLTESANSTNTTEDINNIISIRIHSVVLAKFPSAMERATILIEEFSAQSFIASNGRRFHTVNSLFNLEIPNTVNATIPVPTQGFAPDISHDKYALFTEHSYNNGIYHFNQPITTFDTITLSFGNPFDLINIKKYQITNCVFDSINYTGVGAPFVPGWAGIFIINTVENHYHTGNIQSIKISGFTTDQPVVDALLIEYINSMEFTASLVVDATHIEIHPQHVLPPGSSPNPLVYRGLGLPNTIVGVPSTFTMTFEGYRIISTIEMTYLADKL